MRKIVVATFLLLFSLSQTTRSQTLNLITNPDTSVGFIGETSIEFNGALFSLYKNKNNKFQLARYFNNVISLIPNPDTTGSIVDNSFYVFNNNLFFAYLRDSIFSNNQNDFINRQFAKFDGSTISLIPNPSNAYCIGDKYSAPSRVPFYFESNSQFYCGFFDTTSGYEKYLVGRYNGSGFDKINCPAKYYPDYYHKFVYNSKLCFIGLYDNNTSNYLSVIYTFDGNNFNISDTVSAKNLNLTPISSSYFLNNKYYFEGFKTDYTFDARGGILEYDGVKLKEVYLDTGLYYTQFYADASIVYKNKLYIFRHYNNYYIQDILEFDGANTKVIFKSDKSSYYIDKPFGFEISENKLYCPVYSANGKGYLSQYDGTNFSILPNHDTAALGVVGIFKANNNLYFGYTPKSDYSKFVLAKYKNSTFYFYNFPDSNSIYSKWFAGFQNKLVINYSTNYDGKYQLGVLNDTNTSATCHPTISITATNSQACFGTKVTFTATATDTGKVATYQWKKNNVNVGTNQRIYIDSLLNQNDTIICLVTADSCMGKPVATSNAIYIQSPVKRNWAYITNDSGYIKVLDLNNNSIVKSIKISSIAFGVAISPNKQLAVFTVDNGDKPVVLNTATNTIIGYLPMLSNNSFKAIFSKDGSKIYCAIDTILRVFSSSNLIQIDSAFFPEGIIAYDLLLNENGDKLYLSKLSKIFEINSLTLTKIKTLNLGTGSLNNYYFLANNKVNSRIYITSGMNTSADSGYLAIYDNINDTIIKKIKFTKENVFLKLIESKSKLFMGNFSFKKVYVLSTISNSIIDSINLNETPIGIDSSSDGNFIYVANGKYLTKINTTTHAIVQTITVPNTLYAYSIGNFILEQNDSCASSKVITGNFITPNKKVIKNVSLKLMGTQNNNTLASGNYSFTVTDGNYTLRPTKNNDITKANGVTSIDALLTQRHILNTTKLNSPYKIIAADVDGNKLVNSVDVLRMKRLILGTDTTFTKTVGTVKTDRLWEFVDSAYTFPDTTNPFPFKDSISFTNLTSNKTNQTFIGVKLGDVNYDWNPTVARGIAVNSLELIVNSEKTTNNNLQLSFISSNFSNLAALQTTLHFDNANYEFIGIENGKLQLDYNASKANKTGNIAILWTDKNAEAKSFDKDEVLFTVALKPRSLGIGNLELVVSNNMVETEAWDNNFTKRNIILSSKEIYNSPLATNHLLIYPNPAKGNVTIQTVGAKELLIIDYLGKIISKQSLKNNASILNIKLKPGVYIVQATMQDGSIRNEKVIVE